MSCGFFNNDILRKQKKLLVWYVSSLCAVDLYAVTYVFFTAELETCKEDFIELNNAISL